MAQGKRRAPGTGSVCRRSSDGRWVATVEAGWTLDGKRRRLTAVRRTEAAAEAALEVLRAGLGFAGKDPGDFRLLPVEHLVVNRTQMNPTATVVYVAHGETRPIYVGVTDNFFARMNKHRLSSEWWADMRLLTWEEFPTRAAALEREAQLIRRFDPRGNRLHRAKPSGLAS